METVANRPPAVRTWWYPGRSIGHEFIYPREQAQRLALRQKEPVLTVASDVTSTEQMRSADLARVNAAGQENSVAQSGAERTAPAAAERTNAQADRTPMPAPQPTPTPVERTRTELPRTASPLPLIGLIGLASLVGAGALRLRRR
jgi:hypothetical protein